MLLSGYGISIDLPPGWEGRIYQRPGGHPILHASNAPLPNTDGDFGSGAVGALPDDGVFMALAEYDLGVIGSALFESPGIPVPLRPSQISTRALQRLVPRRGGTHQFFTTGGRPFSLYVVIGSSPSPATLLDRVNQVLIGLSIEPRDDSSERTA